MASIMSADLTARPKTELAAGLRIPAENSKIKENS